MGLFDGNAKREAVENEVIRALSQLPILDALVYSFAEAAKSKPWLTKCQGYYDERKRKVAIAADTFFVEWEKVSSEGKRETIDAVNYAYTESGYVPLHDHINEKGKVDIPLIRVLTLWAEVVQSRLKEQMPNCRFSEISVHADYVTFAYKVPQLQFKDWF